MKKIKLFTLTTVVSLTTIAPLTTFTSCNNNEKEPEDEKVVTLTNANLKNAKSTFTATPTSTSNDSEDAKSKLWQTTLNDQEQLVISEVTGTDEDGKTITINPDWTKQIDKDHMILSFKNLYHDEGNVQYCIDLKDGSATKLTDFWLVETIDEHEAAFQTVGGYIYFVATYSNLSGRQYASGGALIKVKDDYFEKFDSQPILVSNENQWIPTMVFTDDGRPVAHQFAIDANGNALYQCSNSGYIPSNGNSEWGLIYKKMKTDGSQTYEEGHRLMSKYEHEGKKLPITAMSIYSQGNDFYYKNDGNGIVIKPQLTTLTEDWYLQDEMGDERYFDPCFNFSGVTEPYSRHIIKTNNSSKTKIVNIDRAHIFDLYCKEWTPGTDDETHFKVYKDKFDFVDYTNTTVFYLNKMKIFDNNTVLPPALYEGKLNDSSYSEPTKSADIECDGLNILNVNIRSFKVLDNEHIIINGYDNSSAKYIVIKGTNKNNGWQFELDNEKYDSDIENIEVIQRTE